jgi:hypothetical protein
MISTLRTEIEVGLEGARRESGRQQGTLSFAEVGIRGREKSELEDVTFESKHEIIQRVLVLLICFRVVPLYIFVDGLFHKLNSALLIPNCRS